MAKKKVPQERCIACGEKPCVCGKQKGLPWSDPRSDPLADMQDAVKAERERGAPWSQEADVLTFIKNLLDAEEVSDAEAEDRLRP